MKAENIALGILVLLIIGSVFISGCVQQPGPEGQPSGPGGDIEQMPESELWKLCEGESWPPGGCSAVPDPKGKELCEKCEELLGYVKGQDTWQMPESELRELCESESWPSDCSIVPDSVGREMCKKCKELPGYEKKEVEEGIIKEEDITQITFFKGEDVNTACDPDWSPDGTQIVFGKANKGEPGELYIINSDGTGLTKIGPSSSSYGIYNPSWSPVDNRILCSGWEDQKIKSGLFIIDLDKDKTKKIFLGVEYVGYQAWSSDGTKIVYTVYDDSNAPLPVYDSKCDGTGVLSSIWIMNSDGTGKTQLTTDEDGYCSDASFSPDGSKIVYNKGFINPWIPFLFKESPNEIWVMNSDGSDKHMIYTTEDSLYYLHQSAWSKNNEIIFEKTQCGLKPPEVWVMNSDGTNARCLLRAKGRPDVEFVYADIAWDNTGTKIVTTQFKSKAPEGPPEGPVIEVVEVDRNLVTFYCEGK